MRFQFIGTGNARQVPCYGCECIACVRARAVSTFRRGPCSARIEWGDQNILIDAGFNIVDKFSPNQIHTILLTHYHMDHVQGLFHMRWGKCRKIPVIGPNDEQGCDDLFKHPGILDFQTPPELFKPFLLAGMEVTPVPLNHSKPTVGYVFDDGNNSIVYLTDTLGLPEVTWRFLKKRPLSHLILDCSSPPKPDPRNHNSLTEALDIIDDLNPERAYLTHIGHELDAFFLETNYPLPENVIVASDNMSFDTKEQELVDA